MPAKSLSLLKHAEQATIRKRRGEFLRKWSENLSPSHCESSSSHIEVDARTHISLNLSILCCGTYQMRRRVHKAPKHTKQSSSSSLSPQLLRIYWAWRTGHLSFKGAVGGPPASCSCLSCLFLPANSAECFPLHLAACAVAWTHRIMKYLWDGLFQLSDRVFSNCDYNDACLIEILNCAKAKFVVNKDTKILKDIILQNVVL